MIGSDLAGRVWRRNKNVRAAALGLLVFMAGVSPGRSESPSPSQSPEGCYCVGTVGNVDCDYRDDITLRDLSVLIDHLFISYRRLPNLQEANIDGDPAGEISLGDVMKLIDYLYISGQTMVLPDCPQPFNSPPQTRIVNFADSIPFIDSRIPMGAATGIRMNWHGSDLVDHPYDPPPFEFEWKLFGPYTDTEYAAVLESFLVRVFITRDARVLRYGQPPELVTDTFWNESHTIIDSMKSRWVPTSLVICDTSWFGGVRQIICDTMPVDYFATSNVFGTVDTLLRIYDDEFVNSPYYLVADSSHDGEGNVWTTELRDSIFDVYRYYGSATTVERRFIFAVRSRDEKLRPDPTPAWKGMTVIDPKHERDILVLDCAAPAAENGARAASIRTFWQAAVDSFRVQTAHAGVVFNQTLDVHNVQDYGSTIQRAFLTDLLRYKIVVAMQDAEVLGDWNSQQFGSKFFYVTVAMQAGVNVWVAARVPIGPHVTGSPFQIHTAGVNYQNFFGVQQYTFPGWSSTFYDDLDGCPRTDDFIGAVSPEEPGWPELSVDTALLRIRYRWGGENCHNPPAVFPFYPYMQSLGAIPQVGWAEPVPEAEVLYTYKSLYGPVHPVDSALSFEGLPVMHRMDRWFFRIVHSVFTPLALRQPSAQQMVNSVLSWLYDPPAPREDGTEAPPPLMWQDEPDSGGRTEE